MVNAEATNDGEAEVTSSFPSARKLMLDGNELKEIDGNRITKKINKTVNCSQTLDLIGKRLRPGACAKTMIQKLYQRQNMTKSQVRIISSKKRGKYHDDICSFKQHNSIRHMQVQGAGGVGRDGLRCKQRA
jgi:hypothetical protein